ncbi:hypothetical protein HZ326_4477 [Fusarium oxysporum f. sp. albedinis]|nr:hypothetical protein HZ326_4477 [Fusarium oxysporum f. sp. albedinis]
MTAIVHAGQHLPCLVRKLQYIFCFSSTYQANLNVQVLMHTSTDTQMLIVGKCQLIFDTTLNLEARILVDHLTCWGKELKTEQVQYSLLAPSTFESERTRFCKPT